MGSVDTCINHVGTGTGTGSLVIDVGSRSFSLMRDTAEAPGGISLLNILIDTKDSIFLNIINLIITISKRWPRLSL